MGQRHTDRQLDVSATFLGINILHHKSIRQHSCQLFGQQGFCHLTQVINHFPGLHNCPLQPQSIEKQFHKQAIKWINEAELVSVTPMLYKRSSLPKEIVDLTPYFSNDDSNDKKKKGKQESCRRQRRDAF